MARSTIWVKWAPVPAGMAWLAVFSAAMFILARPAGATWPHIPTQNLPVCKATGDQTLPSGVPDGNGGVIITWVDSRNSMTGLDIYAQHVFAGGLVDGLWPPDGLAVCTALGDQGGNPQLGLRPEVIPDGQGGAIVAWFDNRSQTQDDVFAQHVRANGTCDPNWSADGRAVSSVGIYRMKMTPDGTGGAIIAWTTNANELRATHLLPSGALDPNWPSGGLLVTAPSYLGPLYDLVPDGNGGAIAIFNQRVTPNSTSEAHVQHVRSSGTLDPSWPATAVLVGTGGVLTANPWGISDGTGGVIVSWIQGGGVYAQRVRASGIVDPGWPVGGRAYGGGSYGIFEHPLVSDGYGGAIVVVRSGAGLYAKHLLVSGQWDGGWPMNGATLSASVPAGGTCDTDTDGSGGAFVTWSALNGASYDVYVQRVLASGGFLPYWPANGRLVCGAANDQLAPNIVNSGNEHAIVTWQDYRSATDWDIYAQKVDPTSFLGSPIPTLRSVFDAPFDQGGFVNLTFDPSYLDTEDPFLVAYYSVMRWEPSLAGGGFHWQPLQQVDAVHTAPSYSVVVPTLGDSTPAGIPWTQYMVVAYDAAGALVLPSDPDSGYSVDNIPPETPPLLTGAYEAGITHLHWLPNSDADLAGYRLYRGDAASFMPGPTNLIGAPPDTGFMDPGPAGGFYKLSAVDVHGNESGYAVLAPTQTASAGPGRVTELALLPPAPNPARSGARIAFGLPRESAVSLTIYDVTGRREATLAEGVLPAGEHERLWDLRDASGREMAAGLYFVRLETGGRRLTRRLVIAGR